MANRIVWHPSQDIYEILESRGDHFLEMRYELEYLIDQQLEAMFMGICDDVQKKIDES
jgi:hypothetical protein